MPITAPGELVGAVRVAAGVDLAQPFDFDMRVNLRCVYAYVAERCLHDTQDGAAFEQIRVTRVT